MKLRASFIIALALALLPACASQTAEAPSAEVPLSTFPVRELSPAEEKLASMSLEEKAWQMLYVFPEDICGERCCGDRELWVSALNERPAGGICFVSENMPSEEELRAMLEAINKADMGVFLGLDEEGGNVARLAYTLGVTTDFEPMYEYREKGAIGAYENARTIAADIASFGFNMDFAPVADVWTNKSNTVIGRRAYSDDANEAAELVAAAVQGFHSGGVISVLKHFPGHGDTLEDSHYASAHSGKSYSEMRECELLPFRAGMEAGAEVIMVGHIIAGSIDPGVPATLSGKLINGVLRGDMGFDGVVMTDAFTMVGVGDTPEAEAAVRAVKAGCDIILAPADPDAVVEAIMENISPSRIDESVLRILELKFGWGIMG